MHRQSHRAVAGATEDGTMANEVTRQIRSELYLRRSAFGYIKVYVQLPEAQSVIHVLASNDKNYRLALLYGYFRRLVPKSLRCNFHFLRAGLACAVIVKPKW